MRDLMQTVLGKLTLMESLGDINPAGKRLLYWLRRRYSN